MSQPSNLGLSTGAERIAHLLMVHAEASWDELQSRAAATSAAMNELVDRGYVEGDGHGVWKLTPDGLSALAVGQQHEPGVE